MVYEGILRFPKELGNVTNFLTSVVLFSALEISIGKFISK